MDREKRIKSHEVTNTKLIFQLVSGHARPQGSIFGTKNIQLSNFDLLQIKFHF